MTFWPRDVPVLFSYSTVVPYKIMKTKCVIIGSRHDKTIALHHLVFTHSWMSLIREPRQCLINISFAWPASMDFMLTPSSKRGQMGIRFDPWYFSQPIKLWTIFIPDASKILFHKMCMSLRSGKITPLHVAYSTVIQQLHMSLYLGSRYRYRQTG